MENNSRKKKPSLIRFSTGSTLLDSVVGGGENILGYPAGNVINIVGDKSTGKTFLACELIVNAYYEYGKKFKWVYDDCESGFTFNTKELYGFEIMPFDIKKRTRSETVEEWYGNVRKFSESIKSGEVGIYVTDSLDGLSSSENEKRVDERYKAFKNEKEFKAGSYQMGKAKFLSQEFFPNIVNILKDKNILLVVISQTRDKINSMFGGQARAGGRALDFYANTALWLSVLRKIEIKNRAVGAIVKAHAKKSKTPRPFRSCVFSFLFDYGLDDVGSNIDFLFDLLTPEGKLKADAKSIIWDGDSGNVDTKTLRVFLKENDEYEDFTSKNEKRGKKEMLEWITEHEDLKEKFESGFGKSQTREELVEWIEKNNKEGELKERVVEKWENIEKSIQSDRKKRFIDQ